MTIDEEILSNSQLRRSVLETAVDACWSAIESSSVQELQDGLEWMDLGEEKESVANEVSLLTELRLLGSHPEHSEWVREIAEL